MLAFHFINAWPAAIAHSRSGKSRWKWGLAGVETQPSCRVECAGQLRGQLRSTPTTPKTHQRFYYTMNPPGLDPIASTVIEDLIRQLQCTRFVALMRSWLTKSTIRRTADRIVFLYQGKVQWEGSVSETSTTDNPWFDNFYWQCGRTIQVVHQSKIGWRGKLNRTRGEKMRTTRTVREGSVGLLLLLGLGLFLGVILCLLDCWQSSYTAVIEFANVAGMQEGQWFDIVALRHYFSYPTRSKWRWSRYGNYPSWRNNPRVTCWLKLTSPVWLVRSVSTLPSKAATIRGSCCKPLEEDCDQPDHLQWLSSARSDWYQRPGTFSRHESLCHCLQ